MKKTKKGKESLKKAESKKGKEKLSKTKAASK